MKDEEVLDALIDVVQLIVDTPAISLTPGAAAIQLKIDQIKAERIISKKSFSDYFANLSQVVTQITSIEL